MYVDKGLGHVYLTTLDDEAKEIPRGRLVETLRPLTKTSRALSQWVLFYCKEIDELACTKVEGAVVQAAAQPQRAIRVAEVDGGGAVRWRHPSLAHNAFTTLEQVFHAPARVDLLSAQSTEVFL